MSSSSTPISPHNAGPYGVFGPQSRKTPVSISHGNTGRNSPFGGNNGRVNYSIPSTGSPAFNNRNGSMTSNGSNGTSGFSGEMQVYGNISQNYQQNQLQSFGGGWRSPPQMNVNACMPQGQTPSAYTSAVPQVHVNPALSAYNCGVDGTLRVSYTRSDAYEQLTASGIPDPVDLFEKYFPFHHPGAVRQPSGHGVIKISNVPYDVTKNEIVAMLGRDAKIAVYPLSSSYYGIHILFDRATGKSGEVMVELTSTAEAENVFSSLERYTRRSGKPRMVGNRVTKVDIVSQEDLMMALFPKVKACTWSGETPHIHAVADGSAGFNGFMSIEELRQIGQHAQKPGKGQFGKNAPQRPFEALLSILQKYPWHHPTAIFMAERENLYNILTSMVTSLVQQIRSARAGNPHAMQFSLKLSQQLLNELVIVACSTGGFSPLQQFKLLGLTHGEGNTAVTYRLPRLAQWWPFEALSFRPGVCEKLIEYFALLIKLATLSPIYNTKQEIEITNQICPVGQYMPFGGFVIRFEENKWSMDLQSVAEMEEACVVDLIRKVMNKAADEGTWIPTLRNTPNPSAGPDLQQLMQMRARMIGYQQ